MQNVPNVTKRADGKIPTTKVTNELADAVQSILPHINFGQPGPTNIGSGSTAGVIPVRVKKFGGTAGGATAGQYCSFTYDVYPWVTTWNPSSPTGDKIAAAVALTGKGNRVAPWTMDTDASVGEGFVDTDGTFILIRVDEHVADQIICTPPS